MNHEARIAQLEKQLTQLQQRLEAQGLLDDWIPIAKSKEAIGMSQWVIKSKIKNDPTIKLGKHYRMNGNRYEINVNQWQQLYS